MALDHDAVFAPKATSDEGMVEIARLEKRLIITYDKDFADVKS